MWIFGVRRLAAGEKPTSRQTSICGRRRARPTTTDNIPRTDNETRSALKSRWAHRLKPYVRRRRARTTTPITDNRELITKRDSALKSAGRSGSPSPQATRLPYNSDNRQPRTDNETRSARLRPWMLDVGCSSSQQAKSPLGAQAESLCSA